MFLSMWPFFVYIFIFLGGMWVALLSKYRPESLFLWVVLGTIGIPLMVWLGYRVRGEEVIKHHYLKTIICLIIITVAIFMFSEGIGVTDNLMDNLVRYFIPLYLIVYLVLSFVLCGKKKDWPDILRTYIPPALFTLLIAYTAYVKANDFWERSILFQMSDRCLVKDIKLNDETGRIYPIFINQGGDALAYEELVRQYNKSGGEFREAIQKVLLKIHNNIQYSDEDFRKEYFEVCRSLNKGAWTFNVSADTNRCWGAGAEKWDEFDVPNVVSQVRHMTFWTTRARSAKLLQNLDYLKDKRNFNEANWQKLKEYMWEAMFQKLVENISSDSSLIVRKISLDTYKLWVCLDKNGQEKQLCENRFILDNVYNFEVAVEDWENNKPEILSNFKRNIGL